MRIAVSAGQPGRLARPAAVSAVARAAEQLGYSTVWVRDSTALDPIVVLSSIAASTTRVRLGVGFDVAGSRSPELLAKALSTLDVLSEGRLTVSLGRGDGELLDETLDVVESTWSVDGSARPAQRPHPPLLVVANARSQLDRVARRADGWNPEGVSVDRVGSIWAQVRELAASHRRDPDTLQLVVWADMVLTDQAGGADRPTYHGTVEQIARTWTPPGGWGPTRSSLAW